MQTAKSAAASAKESAANVAATAKSGMDKTKATVQEKVERMTAHDPTQKAVATDRKQEKIRQAEFNKQEAHQNNAAARQAATTGGTGTFTAVGRAQNTTPGAGTGIQGNHNYASGTGDGLHTHTHTNTHPTGAHNPGHLTGSAGAPGYGTGQHTNVGGLNTGGQHNHNLGGVNTAGADAVYPDGATGYGAGQHTHNLGGVNTAGGDAMYPDNTMGTGPNTTRNTVGGAPGMGHGTGGTYQ